jgi:hypothetical protein
MAMASDRSGIPGRIWLWISPVPLSDIDETTNNGSPLDIEIDGLSSGDNSQFEDNVVSAVTFDDYGDDWSVGIVPEPAALASISLSSFILLGRRKQANARGRAVA